MEIQRHYPRYVKSICPDISSGEFSNTLKQLQSNNTKFDLSSRSALDLMRAIGDNSQLIAKIIRAIGRIEKEVDDVSNIEQYIPIIATNNLRAVLDCESNMVKMGTSTKGFDSNNYPIDGDELIFHVDTDENLRYGPLPKLDFCLAPEFRSVITLSSHTNVFDLLLFGAKYFQMVNGIIEFASMNR